MFHVQLIRAKSICIRVCDRNLSSAMNSTINYASICSQPIKIVAPLSVWFDIEDCAITEHLTISWHPVVFCPPVSSHVIIFIFAIFCSVCIRMELPKMHAVCQTSPTCGVTVIFMFYNIFFSLERMMTGCELRAVQLHWSFTRRNVQCIMHKRRSVSVRETTASEPAASHNT